MGLSWKKKIKMELARKSNKGTEKTMIQEFFVYGSLQPGLMNWDRLSRECNNAERASIDGHIRVLTSGFGALHVDSDVPQVNAKGWQLPNWTPKNYMPENKVSMSRGWILTLQGTKDFFEMLDLFEGFIPGRASNFYDRKAVWMNGRWIWTYVIPADNKKLDLVYEWTDDTYYDKNDYGNYATKYEKSDSRYSKYEYDWSKEEKETDSGFWSRHELEEQALMEQENHMREISGQSWDEWLDGLPMRSAVAVSKEMARDSKEYKEERFKYGYGPGVSANPVG